MARRVCSRPVFWSAAVEWRERWTAKGFISATTARWRRCGTYSARSAWAASALTAWRARQRPIQRLRCPSVVFPVSTWTQHETG
jgi:hypothetical protein